MEGDPTQHQGASPEAGERLKINGVIIPADNTELRRHQIGASHPPEYEAITGGYRERVGLDSPSSSLFVNEEGKLLQLPMNRRATLLLWMHSRAFRYQDIIAGDALLVGQCDKDGFDTDVPEDLVHVLFTATSFRTEVQVHGEDDWHGNDRRFDNWVDAYSYVLDLGRRWTAVRDVRVVPEA